MLSTHMFLCLHYIFVDKDNYNIKLSQQQLEREKSDYLVGIVLHMWIQASLQVIFPGMFFQSMHILLSCLGSTLLSHVLIVEPLYYAVHRWLHEPEQMKAMHSRHHESGVFPVPSTALVRNVMEHFIYFAIFCQAVAVPYFVFGANHWVVVAAYLLLFDVLSAYGYTNIKCSNHWVFSSKLSPLTYLVTTPGFHRGHRALCNCNFGLFMPLWDHLFGTFRYSYAKEDPRLSTKQKQLQQQQKELLPAKSQDFVFIGHNGGLGHLWTLPEFCFYNIYDSYKRTWLPIEAELLCVSAISRAMRLLASNYKVSRYLVDGKHIGRVISVWRTPLDYLSPASYSGINTDIVRVIEEQYLTCGTRYFGLGNLNKMKQLNDGGAAIVELVKACPTLKDASIRVWTGDTLTAASVYQQILAIPQLEELFYIGASGKIGIAVIRLLLERNIRICAYSSYECITHPNIRYTQDIIEMSRYKYVIVGKPLKATLLKKAMHVRQSLKDLHVTDPQYLLDYTVPFIPLKFEDFGDTFFRHVQIAVLKVGNDEFLRGYYDVCMGTSQNHIYPCHAGCILNMIIGRETDETGDIVIAEMDKIWNVAVKNGLGNKLLVFE